MNITNKLAKSLSNYNSTGSIGSRLRAKRSAPLLEMIRSVFATNGCVKIIDIGGTAQYWNIVPKEYFDTYKIEITLVNIPGTPTPENHGSFTFVTGDGCNLAEFESNSFHIAHSNSVVEHVGDWDRMVAFSKEVKRVANKYFVQTPNFWFPIEPHCMTPFFHWLPKPCRVWLVTHFQLGHWLKAVSVDDAVRIVDSARLLNHVMFTALFMEANIKTEWFFGIPKSFMAIKN